MKINGLRQITLISTSILLLQSILIPVTTSVVVHAGTLDSQSITEETIRDESLFSDDLLPTSEETVPRFFFTQKKFIGKVDEQLSLSFYVDQKVQEALIRLPEQASISEEQLLQGISIEHTQTKNSWLIRSNTPLNTFTLPLIFEVAGSFEAVVDDAQITLEIQPDSNDDTKSFSEIQTKESNIRNEVESREEITKKSSILSNGVEEKLSDSDNFSGDIAEVDDMNQFIAAVSDSNVSTISVQGDLTGATANIMVIDRPILIIGNGFTLNFGNNNFYFELSTVDEPTVLRIENATITKVGTNPLIAGSIETSRNWTLELEDISEVNANTMRLASIPEGRVVFSGGETNFTRTSSTQTFIESKEVLVANETQLTINRGNATIFFSNNTVLSPNLVIEDGAKVLISVASGNANIIDFRGEEASISISSRSHLQIDAPGATTQPTDTGNNVISLTNSNSTITVQDDSELVITTNQAKRGLHLSEENPTISVKDSDIYVTTATQTAINMSGEKSIFLMENSRGEIDSTTGQRVTLTGDYSKLSLINSQVDMNASTGRGIWIGSLTPQLVLDNQSRLTIQNTGNAEALILNGEDALLEINNNSEFNVLGAGTGNNQNVQIGVNNARPQLKLTNEAKLSVRTTSGTGTASNTENNAVHLRGAEPKVTLSGKSEIAISVTSNNRRGLFLNGENAELNINGSFLSVNTLVGQGLNLTGSSPKAEMHGAKVEIETTTGRGIHLAGESPEFLLENCEVTLNNTGNAEAVILEGTDALFSLKSDSNFHIISGGTGTSQNVQIGNNNARPQLVVEKNSTLSIESTSGTGTPSNTANNAIHLRGVDPSFMVMDNSQVNVTINSGARRAIFLNGNNGNLQIDDSDVEINAFSGQGINLTGNNSLLSVKQGSMLNSHTGVNDSIILLGNEPTIDISGENTKVDISSNANSSSTHAASIFMGQRSDNSSNNAKILIQDGAVMNVTAGNNSPAVGLRSLGGQFLVKDNAKVNLENGNASSAFEAAAATLRFIQAGSYSFLIDNAEMKVTKSGGNAPGIRMHGANNHITVKNKGIFEVINPGNGTPNNGATALGNQAIHYTNGSNNTFTIQDPGSQVTLQATNGPALDMENNSGSISVFNGGYFSASGRTSSSSSGIFNAGVVEVDFDNPLYMDFRNYRSGGGNLFSVSSNSTLKATNSDLAVWRNGSDLTSDPYLNFRRLDYSFRGTNFNTLAETSDPDQLNTTVFGTGGLTTYSRLSSNNGRWAIVDELRIPTNADKKIYGRVSLPVGLHDSRPAWTDEARVTVEVISENGSIRGEYKAKTVGDSEEQEGLSIYGEEPRGGLFEIQLDEPLKAGDKVRISDVELSDGELTSGFEHLILTDTVEVFPIIPPAPAKFSSSIIPKNLTTIRGYSENKDVEVSATYNGDWINTEDVLVNEEGNFVLDLSDFDLEEEDQIQVFLRDKEGSAAVAGVVNPPETNNERGNINPVSDFTFHDVTFIPGTILTVGDVGPVSPVDPLDPEVEIIPDNQPEIPDGQGLLSIDFVSQFNFGTQEISVHDRTYYANPQLLMNEDGTVNDKQERPNFVQISDRRPASERQGWQLSVTQRNQFVNQYDEELVGARLRFMNQQLVTAHNGLEPEINTDEQGILVPEQKHILLTANEETGSGTWVYRFGNEENLSESVALDVPNSASPTATAYQTKLDWELQVVPGNE